MRALYAVAAATFGIAVLPAQEPAPPQDPAAVDVDVPILEFPGIDKLKITGEYRFRFEGRFDYDFNNDLSSDFEIFTQRIRLDFDVALEENLRVFVQFQDARYWGEENTTVARTAPGFDVHQGFLEFGDTPGLGGKSRVGRQILSYGNQRLVGGLEWAQQGRSFDGFRQFWQSDSGWTTDVFATKVREVRTTQQTNTSGYFGGLYATHQTEDKDRTIDLYALYLYDEMTAAMGDEDRLTLGARAIQKLGDLELGAEAATQTGERNDRDVPIGETYMVHAHAKLGLGDEGKTYLLGEVNLASGDDPNTNDDERFNNLFPTAHMHLGIMDFAFIENIMHGSVLFGTDLAPKSSLTVGWHYFRSMEETDRVFGPEGTLTNGGVGNSNDLGNEIDIVWTKVFPMEKVKAHIQLGYGLFIPGEGVKDSFMSDDLAHFAYAQGGVKF